MYDEILCASKLGYAILKYKSNTSKMIEQNFQENGRERARGYEFSRNNILGQRITS